MTTFYCPTCGPDWRGSYTPEYRCFECRDRVLVKPSTFDTTAFMNGLEEMLGKAGAPLTDDQRSLIAGYLAAHFLGRNVS